MFAAIVTAACLAPVPEHLFPPAPDPVQPGLLFVYRDYVLVVVDVDKNGWVWAAFYDDRSGLGRIHRSVVLDLHRRHHNDPRLPGYRHLPLWPED